MYSMFYSVMRSVLLFSLLTINVAQVQVFPSIFRGGVAAPLHFEDEFNTFLDFRARFAKRYNDIVEFKERFEIFRSNVRDIVFHNFNNQHNYTLGINQFTDLTADEFKTFVQSRVNATRVGFGKSCSSFSYSGSSGSVSATVDWRTSGAVTPVKNQGQCGSCWSFSATGALEGAVHKATGTLTSFSEQQLVDCSKTAAYGNMGCNGGLMDNAFYYVMDSGLCAEADYPYQGKEESCAASSCQSVVPSFSSMKCFDVPENNQVALKEAVSMNPVSIAIEADKMIFQSYSGGVITGSRCGTNLDHGVLIVGYGEETISGKQVKYWLVKNSWDSTWGDGGYVKIERSESTNDAGTCGIAMSASFPSL